MTKKERYAKIAFLLEKSFPKAEFELHFESSYQLLVAIILAARCTDKLVNEITPAFFASYPSIYDLGKASENVIFTIISNVSYPENKAKYLIESAKIIVNKYKGTVPSLNTELQQLPGIGRKSANTILAEWFGIPAIAVDTHIARVSKRIGLASCTLPEIVEKELCCIIPKEDWITTSHRLILLGRYVCTASSPSCHNCTLQPFCLTHTPDIKAERLLF